MSLEAHARRDRVWGDRLVELGKVCRRGRGVALCHRRRRSVEVWPQAELASYMAKPDEPRAPQRKAGSRFITRDRPGV